MKRMIRFQKLIMKISLIFLLSLIPVLTKAQVSGWIRTCYQNIFFNGNKTIKLLDVGGNSVFSYGSSTGSGLEYFAVRRYVSGGFEYINFPGHTPTVITGPGGNLF